jgi:hypothetical protein
MFATKMRTVLAASFAARATGVPRYDVEPPELTNHDLDDFPAVYKH